MNLQQLIERLSSQPAYQEDWADDVLVYAAGPDEVGRLVDDVQITDGGDASPLVIVLKLGAVHPTPRPTWDNTLWRQPWRAPTR